MACIELEWWAYLSFVFSFFILCLGLNYVVKKINEAKIEERFIRMLQKASTTQSTQVNGPLIAVETAKTAQQFSPPGISLVFNQEENRRRTDPYNLILKPVKEKKFEVSSINAFKSMETIINVISIPSDDCIESDTIPVKKIESERAATKATSSHILTEKVLVKNNGFGRRAVKENSSVTTKSDSYVTELITVKKNEYGHVAGISSLPFTRKDCNSSVLVTANETGRIIFRKNSPSIHIDNVIQDETAKESAVREESRRIKAEGTTSNEINNSVAENPLTNIYAGRMVTTNASSIVEDTVKKPTILDDKKSNEEIHSGCFIKKSVDSIMSKIVNITSKNEDLRREKSATYVAKHALSLTESNRNINEVSYVEKKECGSSAAKETSRIQSDRVEENVTVKKRESGPIVAKETSLHARIQRRVKDLFPVKMSVSINEANATPIRTQSDITVSKYFPIKRSESGSIAARRKDPLLLQECSHTRSDHNVAELSVVRSEPSRMFVKKTEDSTVIAETTNDNPVKKIPFTDKIKALLEDENVIDIVIHEPSSSTKK